MRTAILCCLGIAAAITAEGQELTTNDPAGIRRIELSLPHAYYQEVENDKFVWKPGTVVVIPPDVPHAGKAITDCWIIDVFHPVREDYR